MTRVGSLEVNQDLRFQRRMWRLQRWGWSVLGLVLAAALAGVLGDGLVARSSLRTRDGTLTLTYDRIDRHRSPSGFEIEVTGAAARRAELEIWFEGDWIGRLQTESIYPEPDSVAAAGDRLTYTFRTDGGGDRVVIRFDVTPEGIGLRRGQVGVGTGPSLSFTQLLLP